MLHIDDGSCIASQKKNALSGSAGSVNQVSWNDCYLNSLHCIWSNALYFVFKRMYVHSKIHVATGSFTFLSGPFLFKFIRFSLKKKKRKILRQYKYTNMFKCKFWITICIFWALRHLLPSEYCNRHVVNINFVLNLENEMVISMLHYFLEGFN